MPEAPAATPVLSTTRTCSPCSARCQAVERPCTPAPMTRYSALRMSVSRWLPALEHGGAPVLADGARALDPRAELGLGELGVGLLELDAVGVAGLQVGDQHLARDLVLAARGDREVDLQEGVRVAVEDSRRALLLEQLDVLEPVDVLAGRGRLEVDPLDQADVLLVGEALPGELLGIDRDDLLGLVHRSTAEPSGSRSIGFSRYRSSIVLISSSARSSDTPG